MEHLDKKWKMQPNRRLAIQLAIREIPALVYEAVNLEGIAITLPEVQTILDGITVSGHKISDQNIVINQANTWKHLLNLIDEQKFMFSKSIALELHRIAGKEEAFEWGMFRSGNVTISGTNYTPPPAEELDKKWAELETFLSSILDIYDRAIAAFLYMARTQFFWDVNKRMGRFMMNGILLEAGYPVINVPVKRKQEFNTLMLDFYDSNNMKKMNQFLRTCMDERIIANFNKKTIKKRKFIAHVRQKDGCEQSVAEHLLAVSGIAEKLAQKLELSDAGCLIGLMHDFGKYSGAFQDYIRSETGKNDADADVNDGATKSGGRGKIDHSTAGAQWIYRSLKDLFLQNEAGLLCGQILSICVASHHGSGLIDCLSPEGEEKWRTRLAKEDELTHFNECVKQADDDILGKAGSLANPDLVRQLCTPVQKILKLADASFIEKEFYLGCLTRFLYSCLIDADRIDSADFEHQHQSAIRTFNKPVEWMLLIDRLETHLAKFQPDSKINQIRHEISEKCLDRSPCPQGIYTLTVPTGGGKTLASLRFALHHAQKHGLDHIIYIIPYTSIIEQNASVARKVLGEENVLEHHSNLDPENQTWQSKLLAENWDKPVVFTTMVQFLDAFFGSGTRGARHIHPMTRSLLIFDEAQTIPIRCVHLFCNALNWLVQSGKSTALLCTATQPLLDRLPKSEKGQLVLAKHPELMGEDTELTSLFSMLARVEIRNCCEPGGWDLLRTKDLLMEQYEKTGSVLVIVNTKKWAKDLFVACKESNKLPKEALFHLSTHQCAAHRKDIIKKVNQRLDEKLPVLCISTQLIEAGVDISFSCVVRALAGLDSIAQAAGRCNRNGNLEDKKGQLIKGQVFVVKLQDEPLDFLPDIAVGQETAERVFRELEFSDDILGPEAMRRYFQYYFYNRSSDMTYPLKGRPFANLLDWFSTNQFNVYTHKNVNRLSHGKYPLLMQSFNSAAKEFKAIDAPTKAVIVPYERGQEIISELCGTWDTKIFYQLLRESQQYSVNIFPNIWKKLQEKKGALIQICDTGIYYLDERYYEDEFGITADETGFMSFSIAD